MENDTARSGWVYRQTTILKKWTRVWLVLSKDGLLRYFDHPESTHAKDAIRLPEETLQIRVEKPDTAVKSPDKLSIECLFSVVPRHGSTWQLCAESVDERVAWQIALNQARALRSNLLRSTSMLILPPPPGYSTYIPGQYYNGRYQPPGYVYQSGPGQVTEVCYVDRPGSYYCGPDYTYSMLGGVAAGTLLGTAMFWPLMWWC